MEEESLEGEEITRYLNERYVAMPRRIEILDFDPRVTPEPFGLSAAVLERHPDGWALVGGTAP